MASDTDDFRIRLARKTGYSNSAIEAAWPEWWSATAEGSPSAVAELKFSVARKLGLDPRSLSDDDGPRFMWDDSAKYKNFKGGERERLAITSFGTSISRMLLGGVPNYAILQGYNASSLRKLILSRQRFVRYQDLLALLWSVGVPVIHLRVHPLAAKRMCAMAVSINDRHAILLARDAKYPAATAFHVAHEIGHLLLGHITEGSAVIDMEDPVELAMEGDEEEVAADRFALELLTGDPSFTVEKVGSGRSPRQLAQQVVSISEDRCVEPGTLALCYGYATKEWSTVQAAMPFIYREAMPVWRATNQVAASQIDWYLLGDENGSFIRAVMGGV